MKKVAVIGFGFMGMTHALNILKIKDLSLEAIVDIDPGQIDKNLKSGVGNFSTGNIDATQISGIRKYSKMEDCLDVEEIDAVNICTHLNLHYDMTRKALLHDKHVFLEKPFCLNPGQAEELIALARQRNKILMVGHVVRFMPPYMKLRQWVESGEFGELRFLSLSRFCGVPAWGQWKDKAVKEMSGGALFDLVIHDIDFANYLVGVPSEIQSSYLPGEHSRHDYVSAMWKYNGRDLNVRIEGGSAFHSTFPFHAGYIAKFEKASILYTTLNSEVIRIADNQSLRDVTAGDGGEGYFNEIAYFSDCIKNNRYPEKCTPESSLQAIQLCYKHIKENEL